MTRLKRSAEEETQSNLLASVMAGGEVGIIVGTGTAVGVTVGTGNAVSVGWDVGELIEVGEAVGSSGVCVD